MENYVQHAIQISTACKIYDSKRPEIKTLTYLEEHLTMYLIHDKPIGTTCNYWGRPDIVHPLDDRIVIVEVDEYAHQSEKYTENANGDMFLISLQSSMANNQ